jgi:hypothetical protein
MGWTHDRAEVQTLKRVYGGLVKTFLIFCLFLSLSLSPALTLANEGTIPEPVLPLLFHDIAFTPQAEVVSIQLGLSDWGNGIVAAELTWQGLSAGESITLTYDATDTIYATANTTWLVSEITAPTGTWILRQVYARDGQGRELNLFFLGDDHSFTVPDETAPLPLYTLYFPQVSN